jgi:hypothetical protein
VSELLSALCVNRPCKRFAGIKLQVNRSHKPVKAIPGSSNEAWVNAYKLPVIYICDCLAHGKENIHPSVKSNIHK